MKSYDYYNNVFEKSSKEQFDFYHELKQADIRKEITGEKKSLLKIFSSYYNEEVINIKILEFSRAGFNVDLFGMIAFFPYSQSFIPKNIKNVLGINLEVQIAKVNHKTKIFVVSRIKIAQKSFNYSYLPLSKNGCFDKNHETIYDTVSKYYYTEEELESKCSDFYYYKDMKHYPDYESIIMRALRNGEGDKFGF